MSCDMRGNAKRIMQVTRQLEETVDGATRREIGGRRGGGETSASTSMTEEISQSIRSAYRARLSRDLKIRRIDGIITRT